MNVGTADVAPQTRYRRQLQGADFSLEANTETVPGDGHFYLMQGGEVKLRSDSFTEAVDAYNGLCKRYWKEHLQSDALEERMASAWGLISLEPSNQEAIEVIRQEGTDADVARLEQLRRKSRFAKKGTGAFGRKAKA